jgi:DNA mismatch repair protein MSH3
MVSQRTPSLSLQASSQKKQQSIASFFTAKPAPSLNVAVPASGNRAQSQKSEAAEKIRHTDGDSLFLNDEESPSNRVRRKSRTPKRAFDEDGGNSSPEPKRLKEVDDNSSDNQSAADDDIATKRQRQSLGPVSANSLGIKPKTTGRASKYLFSSSSVPQDENEEEDDEQTRKNKERLHEKFMKRLAKPGSLAEIQRRNRVISEETQEDEDMAEDDEEDQESEPPPTKGKGKQGMPAKKSRDKLTPLEKQVLAIKKKHMDTLLIVEVGYKFRFWGEDARIAAKELNIVCIPGKYRFDEHPSESHLDRFASASIPVHRLHVHVKRLVSAGHKVGVVRQLETAALKAAGDNRNKAFERGLTNLYTKGTYIDDQESLDASVAESGVGAPATGHILCLTETSPKGWGSDEKVQIGLVAVQPSTGDIMYDDWEDGWMRSELETRLLHISPCELLIVGEVSKASEKLLQHLSGSKTNVFGDKARIERIEKPKTMAAQSYSHITKFYADKLKSEVPSSSQVKSSQETGTLLDKVHKLSENATICLSALITHLTDYGLQNVFDLTKNFQSFSARSHMLLNGNTLSSLEIYRNQTDHTERGSLFWTLDRTQTRFGQRLLRKWVGRPLLDRQRLNERVAAVEELRDCQPGIAVDRIRDLLSKIKTDLEKSLIRIYYRRCTRPELIAVLQTLQRIGQEYAHVQSSTDAGFQSEMINEAIASLPKFSEEVIEFLNRINAEAAKKDDKYNLFREEYETEEITDHKVGIVAVEHDLDEFRETASTILKKKDVKYCTVAGIEYLIELENSQLKNLPASWVKISGTKKVSRYHAPEVIKLIRERDQQKEALANACDAAFMNLLIKIGSKYQAFRDCVQSLALLDCLLSLAEVAGQPGYCKPEFKAETGIRIAQGRHPMVEQLVLDAFVPNDIDLSSDAIRALLITGPNMGGKSSYVRSVALIAIMAQIGSYVPANSVELGLLDAVFTRMGAFDNMMKGESTFMVELSETSDILKQATPRSLVILDELGRGTSTHDGVAIAQAVLHHVVSKLNSLTLFITHYQSLARMADHFDGELKNVHMRFTEEENGTGENDITFLYEVGEGVAHRSYGLNVAKLAGLPKTLLDEASRRSGQMEAEDGRKRLSYLAKMVCCLAHDGKERDLDHLVAGLEQM